MDAPSPKAKSYILLQGEGRGGLTGGGTGGRGGEGGTDEQMDKATSILLCMWHLSTNTCPCRVGAQVTK